MKPTENTVSTTAKSSFFRNNMGLMSLIALGIALLIWPPIVSSNYYMHVAVIALTNVIAVFGFNLFFGFMGQTLFGPVAFFGLGAYGAAMLGTKVGLPWYLAVALGPVVAALAAAIISYPILRLRGHTLALGTFGFAYMCYLIIERWSSFTGGSNGIYVPPPTLFGIDLRNGIGYYYIVLIAMVLVYLLMEWIMNSRHGRAIKAIRADEEGASAMGVNVMRYKRVIFVVSAAILGLGGSLVSQQATLLGPDYAAIPQNLLMILMVLAGGIRSNVGMIIGGVLLSLLPVALSGFLDVAVLIYGVILILVIRFMPFGIMGFIRKLTHQRPIE